MAGPLSGVSFIVGLTGGIGSGKTTVAGHLERLGAAVVDTDEISRRLTGPNGTAIAALVAAFGERYVGADGALDRAAMRALAFEDPLARSRLESILHPAIRAEADAALAAHRAAYAVLVVPLLFETRGYLDRIGRTLAVDCDESLQVSRTVSRSGLSQEAVRAIMRTQWPRWRRLQIADDVVWNGGDAKALEPECERLHARYVALSTSPHCPTIAAIPGRGP
jgi:dephospho-CoA kinase